MFPWLPGIAGLAALLASPAWALTLTPLSDGRSVRAGCAATCETEAVPDAPFAPWSISVDGVSQLSSLDLLGMSGSGFAASSGINDASSSIFGVTFSIDEAAYFSLSGSVSAGGTEEHTPTGRGAGASVRLLNAAGASLVAWSASSTMAGESRSFDVEGVLAPGSYTMSAGAAAAGVSAGWGFSLSLARVPEPGVALLLAAGLLGLSLRRVRG